MGEDCKASTGDEYSLSRYYTELFGYSANPMANGKRSEPGGTATIKLEPEASVENESVATSDSSVPVHETVQIKAEPIEAPESGTSATEMPLKVPGTTSTSCSIDTDTLITNQTTYNPGATKNEFIDSIGAAVEGCEKLWNPNESLHRQDDCTIIETTENSRKRRSSSESTWNGKKQKSGGLYAPSRPGKIEGIEMFQMFRTRQEAKEAGVHCDHQSGIAGWPSWEGGCAHAVCLSGSGHQYVDQDYGDVIIYVGSGGKSYRNTEENPEGSKRPTGVIRDQELTGRNLALANNTKTNIPVRVLRGSNLRDSEFAPVEEGYRYDGLYDVKEYRIVPCPQRKGLKVVEYKLVRQPGQKPLPRKVARKLQHTHHLPAAKTRVKVEIEAELDPGEEAPRLPNAIKKEKDSNEGFSAALGTNIASSAEQRISEVVNAVASGTKPSLSIPMESLTPAIRIKTEPLDTQGRNTGTGDSDPLPRKPEPANSLMEGLSSILAPVNELKSLIPPEIGRAHV